MSPYFPELSETKVLDKVRTLLRRSKRYHIQTTSSSKNTHFQFTSGDDVNVYIVGDIHCGAHGFNQREFEAYIRRIEADNKAVVVVIGDLIDNATQGSKGCVFSQKMSPQKQIERSIKLLEPIRDKIIFACSGNHEERTFRQTGSDAMYTIMLGLNTLDKYNYVHGYITIKAGKQTYKLYATHNIGRSESKLKTMARSFADCDLILGGHIHTAKVQRVACNLHNGKIKDVFAVTCGAWLMDESYAISAAYEPVSLAQPEIRLSAKEKRVRVSC